jgi:hypothetical protein
VSLCVAAFRALFPLAFIAQLAVTCLVAFVAAVLRGSAARARFSVNPYIRTLMAILLFSYTNLTSEPSLCRLLLFFPCLGIFAVCILCAHA